MSTKSTILDQCEQAVAATMRAVSCEKKLQVSFATSKHNTPLPVPHQVHLAKLPSDASLGHVTLLRGTADNLALQIRYHDPVLHHHHAPSTMPARGIFDRAEEARCQSLGIIHMPGMAENITAALARDALLKGYHVISGHEAIPLDDIVASLVRETLTGIAPPETALPMLKKWGEPVRAQVALHLAKLAEVQDNQAAFAKDMLALIAVLPLLKEDIPPAEPTAVDSITGEGETPQQEGQQETTIESLMAAGTMEDSQVQSAADTMQTIGDGSDEAPEGDAADMPPEQDIPALHHNSRKNTAYHPFTTAFDEIIAAEDLCSAEELTRLRALLESKLSQLKKVTNRLAHRLQRKLLAKHLRSWDYNLEEGIVDSGKLAQLIADPNYALYYMLTKQEEYFHTTVTLLLDNSGSMRGRPITVAAMTADILAQTLERCGIKVEVLGFTSCDWKGGQSRKAWMDAGKPDQPGRLNDVRHIIYKAADTPWRRAKKNLGLMLREGLLKENIDGEAIMWAHDRLMCRPEERRILMVISDGAPVDDSTLSANSTTYLENHLKEVIHTIENHSSVELIAIGIGHDVNRYYKQAVTIRDIDQLGDTMFIKLAELL
jgi:cobaltochelatase CobT